jgi:lipid-A-disaccharide synthase
MKYYIIAGEASGDLHASNLMVEIKKLDAQADFRCWGGDRMQAAGGVLVKHYRDLAFMGFTEVILNLRTILKNIRFCKDDILQWKPDVLILVDYPGFNLRIAEYAKQEGIRTFYYISPQVWAWKQSRVFKIKKIVDRMFVILPFEEEFYKRFEYPVDFVGHPLLDEIQKFSKNDSWLQKNNLGERPLVALLPGSRKQEVETMLPLMLTMVDRFPGAQFAIGKAPSLPSDFYRPFIQNRKVPLIENQTYDLLNHAHAALVTSGTATLETALFGVPEVVCYKGGKVSYLIARSLVKIKFISLVNLIMDREVVRELIQDELNEKNLYVELKSLLENKEVQQNMKRDFDSLREKLGGRGASAKTAALMWHYLQSPGS